MENNNKKDNKNFSNEIKNLKINNSVLVDDTKTLNLIQNVLVERGEDILIPGSFDEISDSIFEIMRGIDVTHQNNCISRDLAIELMADLFEREGAFENKRFKEYVDDLILQKFKKLLELENSKLQDLLNALNAGKIDNKTFIQKYDELKRFMYNETLRIEESKEHLTR